MLGLMCDKPISKMFNLSGNGTTVTEKLGLDSEVRELKFGSSFSPASKGQHQGTFHTIKYDFKPASVDKTKTASLEVGTSSQVTISMPHYDNNGSTLFKGSTRPYTKECVLIIDKNTGQFVLEKLSQNVQVKKTRQEGNSKSSSKTSGNPSQPLTADNSRPISLNREDFKGTGFKERDDGGIKKSVTLNQTLNPSNSAGSSQSRRANSPLPSVPRHSTIPAPGHSAAGHSPLLQAFDNKNSSAPFDPLVSKQAPVSTMPSLSSIEDLLTTQSNPIPPQTVPQVPSASATSRSSKKSPEKIAGELSDSSSGDDSSSSSEDEDDSSSASDIDMEEVPLGLPFEPKRMEISAPPPPTHKPAVEPPKKHIPPPSMPGSMPSLDLNMPSHLLSEDLQLSESGSDSD